MGNRAGKPNKEFQVRVVPANGGSASKGLSRSGRMSWINMGASASTVAGKDPNGTSTNVVGHITDRIDQVNLTTSMDDLVRSVNNNSDSKIQSRRRSHSIRLIKGNPKDFTSKLQTSRRSAGIPESVPLKESSEEHSVRARAAQSSRVNSCGTLFVDSTVTNQNLEQTIGRLGSVLWELIAHGHSLEDPVHDEIFDETIYHITSSSETLDASVVPDETTVFKFLKVLFKSAQLCAECAIIALIYVHRLTGMAGITLHATNWRRVAIGSIALASKVWDDQAVWNIDYCNVMPMIKIDDMNALERKFILFIQFNVSVDPSLYAKY